MTCIGCPMGCQLDVTKEADGTITVKGAGCGRGVIYGKQEAVAPQRMVTALMPVKGRSRPLSVKTATAVPKEKIGDVLAAIAAKCADAPVKIGDVLIADVCGTGVSIVATSNAL